MKFKKIFEVLFFIVGVLTVLETIYVQGMFTWLIMCVLTIATGLINIVWEIKDKNYSNAFHFALTTVALNLGYMVIGF